MATITPEIVKCITISSSEDENDCMPKIVDAVSLHETQGQAPRKYDIFNIKNRKTVANRQIPTRAINNSTRLAPAGSNNNQIRKPVMTRQAPIQTTLIRKPIIPKPVLRPTTPQPTTSKSTTSEYKRIKPTHIHSVSKKAEAPITISDSNGSTELFQKFRIACQKLGTAQEVTNKIWGKVERAYSTANLEYISSEAFRTLLKTSIHGILNTSGSKPWHIVRSVVVELKHHKLSKKNKTPIDSEKGKTNPINVLGEGTSRDVAGTSRDISNDVGEAVEGEDDEEEIEITDPKKRRQVRKLSQALRKVDRRIKQLEEREIGLDDMDDEDSAYIKVDRYKTHFAKIYKKYCELTDKPSDAERIYLRKVSFSGSPYPEINRCLEMFYNKNRQFPDFQDVKKLVQRVNVTKKMRWQPIRVHDIAEKTFKEFGEMLKRLRQYDDYEVMTSYLVNRDDPAKQDSNLQQKLHENAVLHKKKEQEVIDSFAKKQMENLEQAKLSDTSDSNSQSSEIDSASEDENYRMSKNNEETFKDDFKSDEEVIEDPRTNFNRYLALKPNVENKNKDSEIEEGVKTKEGCMNEENKDDKDTEIKSIDPDVSKHFYNYNISSEVEKNNSGSGYKRKISLLSSEDTDEEYKISYVKKEKRRSTDRSSENEKENLHFQNKLRDDKKGKSRIKRIKLLEEIISSDETSKKRNITLSLDDSSDSEVENRKVTDKHQADEHKIKNNLLNKNLHFQNKLREDKKGKSRIKSTKLLDEIISSDESSKKRNIKLSLNDSSDSEEENVKVADKHQADEHKIKNNLLNKNVQQNNITSSVPNLMQDESFISVKNKHKGEMIIDNDNIGKNNNEKQDITDEKQKTTNVENKEKKITHSQHEEEKISDSEDKSVQNTTLIKNFSIHKLSEDNSSITFMKRKIELLPEFSDSDESEKNEDIGAIKRRKIQLSNDDSSEDEKYYKSRREKKSVSCENKLFDDQEYILSRSRTITLNRRIKKVRGAKKIVVTPTNARRNKSRNLSNSRTHNKGTESEQDDDFYKISAHNLHRNRIRSSASNSPAPSIADSVKSSNSIARSDTKTKNFTKSCKDNYCASPSVVSCNLSENEILDTDNNTRVKIENKENIIDCETKIDLVVKESSKNKEKINDGIELDLKKSDSNESSEEKELPMALEDSDYGVDEREDSDEITPKKFIIKKIIQPKPEDSNNLSSSNRIKTTTFKKESKSDAAKKLYRGNENSVSSEQSKNSVQIKEDSDGSELDDSVVIISEDILDQPCPDKTNVNESKQKISPRLSDKKSNSSFKDSSSDSDLNEAIKLCEVNISDSEPEALNIDDESSDLSDSNVKKPTQVVQPTKRRKEPTPELCIIKEKKTSKPSSKFQLGGSALERQVVQNLVASMPIRKPAVNPLIRPPSNSLARKVPVRSINPASLPSTTTLRTSTAVTRRTSSATTMKTSTTRTINPGPLIRSSPIRSFNPAVNRRTVFNPVVCSTPIQPSQQRFQNRNQQEKVMAKKVHPAAQKELLFVDPHSKGPTVRPNRIQSNPSSNAIQINRKVANGVQINTNKVLHQTVPRRQQQTKFVPAEEDIIVLD